MNSSNQNVHKASNKNSEFGQSTTDKFNKELSKHGYFQHSHKAPSGYIPPSKPNTEEQEPYRREVGKTSNTNQAQSQPYSNFQNSRDMGSRNINRRIVEENVIRNASAERAYPNVNSSFREESLPVKNMSHHKYNNTLDKEMSDYYQNQNNRSVHHNQSMDQVDRREYLNHLENMNRRYNKQPEEQENEQSQYEQQHPSNNYLENYYHPRPQSRDEQIQTEDSNNQKPTSQGVNSRIVPQGGRDRSVEPRQTVKYEPPQVAKSVQLREPEHVYPK